MFPRDVPHVAPEEFLSFTPIRWKYGFSDLVQCDGIAAETIPASELVDARLDGALSGAAVSQAFR